MRKRTFARECALKILYRVEISKESVDSSLKDFWSKSGESVNKEAHDFHVLYVPVEKNQFYDASSGVKMEQIRAIMHEYIGIVYYWFKGYMKMNSL